MGNENRIKLKMLFVYCIYLSAIFLLKYNSLFKPSTYRIDYLDLSDNTDYPFLVGNFVPKRELAEVIRGRKIIVGYVYGATWVQYQDYSMDECLVDCSIQFDIGEENAARLDGVINHHDRAVKMYKEDKRQIFITTSLEPDGRNGGTDYRDVGNGVDIVSNFHFWDDEIYRNMRAEGKQFMVHNFNYFSYNIKDLTKLGIPKHTHREVLMSAFMSNGSPTSDRHHFLQELMEHGVATHSFGSQLKNADESMYKDCRLPESGWYQKKICVMRQYRFHYAAENTLQESYITEKYWMALIAGVIPVVYGAPNIKLFCPNELPCHISSADFNSAASLARYILKVHRDEKLYKSYLEWKKHPPSPQMMEIARGGNYGTSLCSLCIQVALLQAKREGQLPAWNITSFHGHMRK